MDRSCQSDDRVSATHVPIFCVSGPSAAGKTTFVEQLAQRLADRGIASLLIACDDYYRSNWTPDPHFGFDTVAAIDTESLRQDIRLASRHQAVSLRVYDMRTRRVGRRPISNAYSLILLEGSYGPQELVGDFPIETLVYLEEALHRRLFRRLRRDVQQRQRPPGYVIRQMIREMLPGERTFIHPLRDKADLVVRDHKLGIEFLLEHIDPAHCADPG